MPSGLLGYWIMSLELNEEVSARDKNLGINCILMLFETMEQDRIS